MNSKPIIKISKFLSLLLRHKPETINLNLDQNGWADIDELIEKAKSRKYFFTREILDEVVKTDNKQRYTYNDDKSKIRANQGHSITIIIELEPLQPPPTLYHGTSMRFLDSIMSTGIDKRNRQHVHLSHELDTARKVGSRHGKVVILHIDSEQMYNDGITFYRSKNGVWLTEYVDIKYIQPL